MKIRPAQPADLVAINEIYNYYVQNSTCTFDLECNSIEQRTKWFDDHKEHDLPIIVAESDKSGSESVPKIIGWGSLSRYHTRPAYRSSVEFSIYIDHEHHQRGLGKTLLDHLIDLARKADRHCVVGLICSENEASIRMVQARGFEKVGELKEIGRKYDRWLNVAIFELLL